MKIGLLIIIVFALIPFVFLNVDASCDKQVGHADESCTPAELLEICDTLWSPRYDGSATPGNIFCRVVYDLDLNEDDVRKLGIHLDWHNYAMQSSKDFVNDWGFYQDHAITDTLLIYPSISMRDSLPPTMKVQISFDYVDESEIKTFDKSLMIYMKYNHEIIPLPENTWVIMPQEEPKPYSEKENVNDIDFRDVSGEIICKGYTSGGGFLEYPECGPIDKFVKNVLIIVLPIVGFVIGFIVWRKRK